MSTKRYAIHPNDFKKLQATQIREAFLVDTIFQDDLVVTTYTHYDRLIIGGAKPVTNSLPLASFDTLKSNFFLQRREIGIINVGEAGAISVDGQMYTLLNKEALYIGRGAKEVVFQPGKNSTPLYYFNSAPAHTTHPTRKISYAEAETVEIGSLETSNHRTIRKLIVNSVLPTCQLQMGLTELKKGSVWNTMPPHTHDRRMEAYFYFEVPGKSNGMSFHGRAG